MSLTFALNFLVRQAVTTEIQLNSIERTDGKLINQNQPKLKNKNDIGSFLWLVWLTGSGSLACTLFSLIVFLVNPKSKKKKKNRVLRTRA